MHICIQGKCSGRNLFHTREENWRKMRRDQLGGGNIFGSEISTSDSYILG